MEEISFEAPDKAGEQIRIQKEYVEKKLEPMNQKISLAKYLI